MSAANIEREVEDYLALAGYEVRARVRDAYHADVIYNGVQIGSICLLLKWRCHQRGARKARRIIRDHQRSMKILAPVTRAR